MVTARTPRFRSTLRLGFVLLTIAGASPGAAAGQSADEVPPRAVRSWFADQYHTRGRQNAGADAALDTLAQLWTAATASDTERNDRVQSFRNLIDLIIRFQEGPENRYTEQARAAMAARVDEIRGLTVPPDPLPVETAEPGDLGRVEVRGTGPVPLVLLSDIDYDGAIYGEFVEQNSERFTMYVVTLPGAGGTPPLPPPVGRRPSDRTWWKDVGRRVLSLIEERKIDRPVIVGTMSSVYLASRLAIDHPDEFRAAVLLHGLVSGFLAIPSVGSSPTPEQRETWIDATLPNFFPPPSRDSVIQTYLVGAGAAAIDSGTARTLSLQAARTHPNVVARYTIETSTTDLHADFARLEVPTLVIPSIHDESSPIPGTEFGSAQWLSLALDYPDIPLTVVPFRATRNYAAVDRPVELGEAIDDFLAGREVRGTPADPALTAYRISPRTGAVQVLGATEVAVEYSSPAARGRTIWGALVPYDQTWRAGAGALSRITFSRGVKVNGQPLPAGAYSILVTPRERAPWTLVLNRVDIQYGMFTYDPAHDAVSVELDPVNTAYEEHLRYRIEPVGPVEGRVELTWAGKSISFDVEAAEGTGFVRIAAQAPERFRDLSWTQLAVDTAGDGRIGSAPDARTFSYHYDRAADTVWFRFDLHNTPTAHSVGMNIAVDTDLDQHTGSAWWGANSDFRYDRLATAWVMQGLGNGLWGTVGVGDHASAAAGNYSNLGTANLAVAVDVEHQALILGLKASDLDGDGRMRLIGTVGTHQLWSDEAIDQGSAEMVLNDT